MTPHDHPITLQLRNHTPAVLHGQTRDWKFFDGPSGTQVIDGCIAAIRGYFETGSSNRFGLSPSGDQTEQILVRARRELAALLGANDDYTVVFGQNMTSLAYAIARAVARTPRGTGSKILLSELEHFGNVDPWRQSFAEHGVTSEWIPVDTDTLALDEHAYAKLLESGDVALVGLTLAANSVGTIPQASDFVAAAHAAGALVAVDGVQAVHEQTISLSALKPDIFFCSAYKFYGPHIGAMLIRNELADGIRAYKLTPAPESGTGKFETGCQNHEAIAGLVGTIDALGRLVGSSGGDGARQAIASLSLSQGAIADWIDEQLRQMDFVTVFRPNRLASAVAPTVAFRVRDVAPEQVAQRLRARGIFINHGDLYASRLAERLGIRQSGGWARAGVAGYTTWKEAHELVDAVSAMG